MRTLLLVTLVVGLGACADERDRTGSSDAVRVHPAGILDPASADFHGKELERRDWDFKLCQKCHGEDYSGGAAKVSCLECHKDEGGPTACSTCHRADNESATHKVHRENHIDCADCHTKPASWDQEGHILRDGKADPRPAEVNLGDRANLTPDPTKRLGPATYESGTCKNVYCHGDVLGNSGGLAPEPQWTAPVVGGCNRCHGAPPPSHAQDQCASCHPAGAPHIDGTIQVGRTSGCDGCHGNAGDPAPPYDLSGNEFTTALGVGAHQAHLQGLGRLRAPLQCSECHQVPTSVTSPGHIDTPLPAEVNASLGWNRTSATCTNAWCHGTATPVWTQEGGAACGSCHGIPPATGAHAGVTSIQACTACHPRVIDGFGNFLFTNGVTAHMDGDVDVF